MVQVNPSVWLSGVFGAGIVALALASVAQLSPQPASGDPGLTDGSRARAFESHYDAAFPARTLGVNVWGAIEYLVFREGRPGVVVGHDDWLYTSEEFTAPPGAPARVEARLDQVAEARDALARQGTALVVALVPTKARVYPEHLPSRHPDPLHAQLYDRLLASMRAQGIAAPDLLQALQQCKARMRVFLRTDTHWTPEGADCAARAIGAEVSRARLRLPPVAFKTTQGAEEPHAGDLVKFLALSPWFERLQPPAETIRRSHTLPRNGGADDLLGDAPAPRVLLIGTSYSANPRWNFVGSLQEALRADVGSLAVEGAGPFAPMAEFLGSAKSDPPRLVIWELPERYFPMTDATVTQSLLDPGGKSS